MQEIKNSEKLNLISPNIVFDKNYARRWRTTLCTVNRVRFMYDDRWKFCYNNRKFSERGWLQSEGSIRPMNGDKMENGYSVTLFGRQALRDSHKRIRSTGNIYRVRYLHKLERSNVVVGGGGTKEGEP